MSINIIVVAAIALLVLIILAVLVLRFGRNTDVGTRCVGGNCVSEGDCDTDAGYTVDFAGGCPNEQECCRPPLSGAEE